MAQVAASGGSVEWRIRVADGSSENLVSNSSGGLASRVWLGIKGMIAGFVLKVWKFLEKAWDLGVNEPKKVIHCLKVGLALTVVSLFYYMRPLYEGVGGNAMWAIMTVVVVFENNVGQTLSKSLNRVSGTCLAGFLAVGVHWIASQIGDTFEPIIVGVAVFLLASAATFSRFIPTIKARFDYGAMIFILTFSLVSVSGYRVDKLLAMAHNRLSTIFIGTSLCIIISMLVCPIWAGEQLFLLITRNMDKLANSLDGCVAEYFSSNEDVSDSKEESLKILQGYNKCVLNSKAMEESTANFARWEPAHGRFNFQHPWKQYLKIGASMRSCACCIEALNSCIYSENQAPDYIKKHLSDICLKVSMNYSNVIKELAVMIRKMRKSSKLDFSVLEMNTAVLELQDDLKSLPNLLIPAPAPAPATTTAPPVPEGEQSEAMISMSTTTTGSTTPPIMEVIQIVTLASLLIEISARVEEIVDAVEELASIAAFKPDKKSKIKNSSVQ